VELVQKNMQEYLYCKRSLENCRVLKVLFVQFSEIVWNKQSEAANNAIYSICYVSASSLLRSISAKEKQTNSTSTYNLLRETRGWVATADMCLPWQYCTDGHPKKESCLKYLPLPASFIRSHHNRSFSKLNNLTLVQSIPLYI
jgi:hypothetical protein